MMIRIDSGYFVAGVVIEDGIATRAAPIVGYMVGWPVSKVYGYCNMRRWRIKRLDK